MTETNRPVVTSDCVPTEDRAWSGVGVGGPKMPLSSELMRKVRNVGSRGRVVASEGTEQLKSKQNSNNGNLKVLQILQISSSS